MSHTPEDLYVDFLLEQPYLEEEQAERDREVVESFTQERLKAYYVAHPDVAQKPIAALANAKTLLAAQEPQAALVMAGVAIEVGYKAALLNRWFRAWFTMRRWRIWLRSWRPAIPASSASRASCRRSSRSLLASI